jgi:hypothetical protein
VFICKPFGMNLRRFLKCYYMIVNNTTLSF